MQQSPAQRAHLPNGVPAVRLVIGVPNGGNILTQAVLGLAANFDSLGYIPQIIQYEGCYVDRARHHIVDQARKMGAEYLFFLDTDVVLPPDAIVRLLKRAVDDDLDVIGGTYVMRRPPHTLVGERYDGERVVPGEGLVRMRILPTGAMLINLRVFDTLEQPYFQTPVMMRPGKEGGEYLQEVGEDVHFCERLVEQGRQIWCDMTLSRRIGHVASVVLTIDGVMNGMRLQQIERDMRAKSPS